MRVKVIEEVVSRRGLGAVFYSRGMIQLTQEMAAIAQSHSV